MKTTLVVLLFLTGCTLNTPVSQFDQGVAQLCVNGPQSYKGHEFNVVLLDSVDDIYSHCGPNSLACTNYSTIYVPQGPNCPKSMAHELNHIVGNHWVDKT